MFNGAKGWVRRRAAKMLGLPTSFYGPNQPFGGGPPPATGPVHTADGALTLSPFWAGVRLYQSTIGSLPLVTYQAAADGGISRLESSLTYWILHERLNPAMSRPVFFEHLVGQLFLEREYFAHVRLTGDGYLVGVYPIHCSRILQVWVDEEWNKLYAVQTGTGVEFYRDDEVIHLHLFSRDGVRGIRLLDYAAEALGLHKQVQTAATTYYTNAVRPSGYLKYKGRLDEQAVGDLKKMFLVDYAGVNNRGNLPMLSDAIEYQPFEMSQAKDAEIIPALAASVADVARWLGLSPLLLGDLTRGTYANLAADNQAFYQRSIRPLLEKIEAEFNAKIFGFRSSVYCQFDLNALLRGDPREQAEVGNIGVQNGSLTVNENRRSQDLPPLPGGDVARTPLNMGSATDLKQISGKPAATEVAA